MFYGELVPVLTRTLSTLLRAQMSLRCTYRLCDLVNLRLDLTSQPHWGVIFADTTTKSTVSSCWGVYVASDTKLNPNWLKCIMAKHTYGFCYNPMPRSPPPWGLFFPVLHFSLFGYFVLLCAFRLSLGCTSIMVREMTTLVREFTHHPDWMAASACSFV